MDASASSILTAAATFAAPPTPGGPIDETANIQVSRVLRTVGIRQILARCPEARGRSEDRRVVPPESAPDAGAVGAVREKVRGHYGYYGIIGNSRALARFLYEVERCWHKWLNRRSQRGNLSWARMRLLLKRYPLQCRAFVSPRAAKPCHEEPDASITHVRICGGRGRSKGPRLPDRQTSAEGFLVEGGA